MAMLDLTVISFDGVVRVILQLVAIGAPIWALITYQRNARIKRAEWLSSLHGKFFESANYKKIRHILDYEPPALSTLREGVEQGGSDELVESFVDYLNFFEFIASLWKLDQLRLDEVAMLFRYYLENLAHHAFVTSFIQKNGFENLEELLAKLSGNRKAQRQ
jgi:hypothetical protein